MKLRYLLLLSIGTIIAASTGWLMDFKGGKQEVDQLQAPDNIDYYMKTVDYRAFNDEGRLHYHLLTPYLEHYIREDASHLQTPHIDYYPESEQWRVKSESGVLQHREETLTLNQQVSVRRVVGSEPLLLESDTVILRSPQEQMEVPTDMILIQGGLTLHAASAMLDMKRKYHQFTRVKATYDENKDTAG